jgi:hypothetical protein
MERVLKPNWLTPVVLLVFLLGCAQSTFATTAIVPPDDDMIIGARVIVKGRILSIESRFDEQQGRIFTYIKLKVQEVLKGQITERKIVIKELGGQVGDRLSVVYGNPEFALGEQVLMYLDTWKDGSLRTYQMFLGKFSIVKDEKTGHEFAVRGTSDEHVVVLPTDKGKGGGAITDRMEVSAYIAMVRSRLAANIELSRGFEQTYYSNVPTLASPPGYGSDSKGGEIHPQFVLMNPPARWFEPDTGQAVPYTLNPDASTDPQVPPLVVDPADIAAAANSWSTVQGCGLHISFSGNLDQCYLQSGTPGINVVSNNCDGRNSPSAGCAGILAWGGWSGGFYSPIVINGTTFQYRITQGFVSCNPWAACNFGDHCSVQFIVTHEMGHALGLGHSQFQQATMYAIAYQIARCAVIWTDDQDAIRFVYPGSGGGPGPLSITTTSLPNGTVGSAYSQSVIASGGTPPYAWSLVQGQGTLPPGLSLSAAGAITGAPTTAGTYNFTVKVTDNVAATAQKALGIVIGSGGGGALNSQFVSQTVPTAVQPGQAFTSNLKFLNTGTQTWSGSAYYFGSQNPPLNQTWGGNGVSLLGFSAAPGEVLDVTFTATAPTTPGTYNFQWQMYQNGGVGFFGQMSTNVAIQVGSSGTDNAAFVSQSVTQNMSASQTSAVSVTMRNTGTTTWTAGNYYLGSQNPQGNSMWGLNRVNLATSVAPSAQVTFSFNITAPAAQGTYNFQWQVAKDSLGNFGALSSNAAILVYSNTADTDSDCIPDAVELSEGTNPLVKDNDIFNNARLFAMQQYRDYLGREGDSGGIAYWTNLITSGQQTRAQVIDSFFNSPEFQAVTPIARLYFAYFLRIPDYAGLLYWVNLSRNGMSLDSISEAFAQSPEFITRYGSLNNADFVTLVYQNVLGRAPDPAGFAYWTGLLNSGTYTRGQVMLGFSESPEYRASSFNKVYVTQMYVGMLRRSPDQGGFDYWVHQMELGQSGLNLINGFLVAPEYRNRFLP